MHPTRELLVDETSRERFGAPTHGLREQIRRLRVRFHPRRRLYPRRAGLFTLGTPIVLGVAAVNAGNNLLFILLALSLVLIVLSGLLSERNLYGLDVRVESSGRALAGEPARVIVRFTQSAGRFRARYSIRLAEVRRKGRPELGTPLDVAVPLIERRDQTVVGHRVFATRGRKRFRTLELSTHFPFGLFRKVGDVDAEADLVVWPKPVPVPAVLTRPESLAPEGQPTRSRGLGLDVYGLREREEWDLEQRVHALRSLMLGRDVVLETEASKRPEAWLGFANTPGADPEALERAIELAASTLVAWREAGYAVGLETVSGPLSPDQNDLPRLLDELALIEAQDSPLRPVRARIWIVPEGSVGLVAGSEAHQFVVGANGETKMVSA